MADQRDPVADIHDHLVATRDRPLPQTAQRWIGEAEAITGDLVHADVDTTVRIERVRHVRSLLEGVGDIDDEETAAHVEAALARADDMLED